MAIAMPGRAAPLGYLLSGLLLIVFAAGFTAMSRHVRNAGAFHASIGRGLGRASAATAGGCPPGAWWPRRCSPRPAWAR
ncbi:hypothetical protein [Streptomyces sirii]|uniref:hypothetical protein n=1 Tax=Streptomyces sirii TaxID=3127701 RepID=UPI003D367D01